MCWLQAWLGAGLQMMSPGLCVTCAVFMLASSLAVVPVRGQATISNSRQFCCFSSFSGVEWGGQPSTPHGLRMGEGWLLRMLLSKKERKKEKEKWVLGK